MSTIMWKGLVSEDYNASGNWDGDAVPGAGDTVIFSPLYNNPVTQNLDQGTTAISDVIVEPGYTADIGSSALYYKATFSKFRYSGGGLSTSAQVRGLSRLSPAVSNITVANTPFTYRERWTTSRYRTVQSR